MDLAGIVSFVSTSYGAFGRNATLLLLAALLLERAFDHGWIKFGKFRKQEDNDLTLLLKRVLSSQEGLQLHYNHDTTKILEEISANQKVGLSIVSKIQEGMREGFKGVSDKFTEWDRYGIKTLPNK